MEAWLLVLFLLCIAAIWLFRAHARKSFLKGREPRQLVEIHAKVQDQVSKEVFNEVWSKVGEAFTIDPRLIEPSDTLKALSSVDSWDLGKGEDALSQWIEQERFGKPPALATVLDLAKWVQTSRLSRA
ncbi:hypothetical protein [Chitinimonas naiadis]